MEYYDASINLPKSLSEHIIFIILTFVVIFSQRRLLFILICYFYFLLVLLLLLLYYLCYQFLTIILGDGNRNNERTTFPDVLQSAMLRGWDVEVWSWSFCTSTIYQEFLKNYPGRYVLRLN